MQEGSATAGLAAVGERLRVRGGSSRLPPLPQRRVKAVTSREAKAAGCGVEQPLWMRGYHERLMRNGLNREAAARYIVANPVRAGLVRSCREYPYWDAIWLE